MQPTPEAAADQHVGRLKLKEAEIWQVQEWNWKCPECGHDNSFTMEPPDYKIMKCGLCGGMFKQKAASQQGVEAETEKRLHGCKFCEHLAICICDD